MMVLTDIAETVMTEDMAWTEMVTEDIPRELIEDILTEAIRTVITAVNMKSSS